MSASVWDRAVDAAAKTIGWSPDSRRIAQATLKAALPVLLDELASEVDALNFSGHPALTRSKVLRIVRGFAAEVTQ